MQTRDREDTEEMLDEAPGNEHTFSPRDVFRVIWQRLYTIVLVAIVLTGSALAFSLAQTPTYETSILMVVGQETPVLTEAEAAAEPARDIVDSEVLIATLARAVETRPVAQAAVERLNLPEGDVPVVLENMTAAVEPGTAVIEVSYEDTNPRRAQLVANAIGEAFSDQASELNLSATPITAQVLQPATFPETPASPRLLLNAGLALVIGILLGTVLAFMFEFLDDGRAPRKKSSRK